VKGELRVGLDAPLPSELAVGAGTVVLVAGWCYAPEQRIEALELTVDGRRQPVLAHGMPRLDLLREHERSGRDPQGHAYRSGFWGIARVPAGDDTVRLGLRATLRDGTVREEPLAAIGVRRPEAPAALSPPAPRDGPLVAVCMATYDPPDDLLARQLDSLRGQTHANWVCVISDDRSRPERYEALLRAVGDDPRFAMSRADRRLGFFANFERALELAPREAAFVALADQDDAWHPDKLETLLARIGSARLITSDARVVGRDGAVVGETFWDRRTPNHTDLLSQLVANAVTGAAALFPRALLDDALPFPPGQWNHFHDHWLGIVALAGGDVEFVERPLYDYVQHSTAAIGHEDSNRMPTFGDRWRALRRDGLGRRIKLWRRHYFADALRVRALAELAELRVGDRIPRRKHRALARYLAAERSPLAVARLFARGARELARRRPQTLGAEWMLGYAFLWRRLAGATARDRPQRALRLDALPPSDLGREKRTVTGTLPGDVAGVADKVAPLDLQVVDVPARVNVLIPALDLEHFFAGYIGKLNLALRLARRGLRVRVLLTDPGAMLPGDWARARAAVEAYDGLAGFFDAVEVGLAREPGGVQVSAGDRFVATTWWTAHIAAAATAAIDGPPFHYLIQEYEPFTFPNSSWSALAEASYALEHTALFSTELLRDWFRRERIGVYASGDGDALSAAFENAITPVAPPAADVLAGRRPRRLLFYARPEPHAARNLYELGMLGLRRALQDGAFAGWELRGIGTVALGRSVPVGDAVLELLPRTSQDGYAQLLAGHDVGLALMHTPHPSLVPIEMASAGLVTVTSTFANKTPEALAAISANLIAAPPTVDGVARALAAAAERAEDAPARVAGADVRWARSWDDAFGDALIDRVVELLAVP
jgi:glycosyltransferase involved in cell wall biosynthesis